MSQSCRKVDGMPTFRKKVSLISVPIISHSYIYSNATSNVWPYIVFALQAGRFPENLRPFRLQEEGKGPERLGGGSSEPFAAC